MDKLYFGDREITIKRIFENFNLAIVVDVDTNEELHVDINFLSDKKDDSCYIKLK